MSTNNEIAAFEDFRFNIGDSVRFVAERILTRVVNREAREFQGTAAFSPVVGVVIGRYLAQDESGISRIYWVRGVNFNSEFKEFELESVIA